MKKVFTATLLVAMCVLVLASCDKKTCDGSQPASITKSDVDSVSYLMGYSLGMQLKQYNMGPLSVNQIIKGIQDAGKDVEVDYMVFQETVSGFMEKRSMAVAEEMTARSEKMLTAKEQEDGVVKTESGLLYKIIREGEGVKPGATDTVEVNYEGKNLDGKIFDSSYERGETTTFPLNGVIAGWTEGLQYVGEGGEIMLWIPAELAYGTRGAGADISPNEALTFKVELVSVKPAVEKAE